MHPLCASGSLSPPFPDDWHCASAFDVTVYYFPVNLFTLYSGKFFWHGSTCVECEATPEPIGEPACLGNPPLPLGIGEKSRLVIGDFKATLFSSSSSLFSFSYVPSVISRIPSFPCLSRSQSLVYGSASNLLSVLWYLDTHPSPPSLCASYTFSLIQIRRLRTFFVPPNLPSAVCSENKRDRKAGASRRGVV